MIFLWAVFGGVGGEAPDLSSTKGTKSPLCMLAYNHNSMLITGRQDSLEYWLHVIKGYLWLDSVLVSRYKIMDNRKRPPFLIYAQTLCITPHKSQIYTLSYTQV